MMTRFLTRIAIGTALALLAPSLFAQAPTASGTINATLINKNGIALIFDTDANGVTLGSAGTSAATVSFGNIAAFGPLATGVTRTQVTATNFTVRTVFDVQVIQGGLNSTTYTLRAQLATALPTGLTLLLDGITLLNGLTNIQTNGAYNDQNQADCLNFDSGHRVIDREGQNRAYGN